VDFFDYRKRSPRNKLQTSWYSTIIRVYVQVVHQDQLEDLMSGIQAEDDEPPEPGVPDPMGDEQWAARLSAGDEPEEPGDETDAGDWIGADELAVLTARAREVTAAEARAAVLLGPEVAGLASAARRGPGLSGPMDEGEYGPLGALARGGVLDTARPCGGMTMLLEDAVRGGYAAATDDEVMGAVCGWHRVIAWATGQMYAGTAEFIRRRPAEGGTPGDGAGWSEFTATEIAHSLAESRSAVETMLGTAQDLAGKLPGTMTALLDGDISDAKARLFVRGTSVLDPAQAREAEAKVLGRAATLTPGGLRAAITRAVIEIDPEAAARRREYAASKRRVEVRPEESGNSCVAAREVSAEIAAAIDAELSARARELKLHGIGTGTDDRRVLAFLEKFGLAGDLPGAAGTGRGNGNGGGVAVPAKLTLTATIGTLQGLRDRAGEVGSHGPVDPALTRRLAAATLRHRATKVGVVVTDELGRMTGYGAARPPTRAERERIRRHRRDRPGNPAGTGPPDRGGPPGGGPPGGREVLTFTPVPEPGQLNSGTGYGTWLIEPGHGGQDLIVTIKTVSTDPCDHRMETPAHDPGRELREVTNLRYGSCTGPVCRRPATQSDWEHNIPHDQDGRTCLCNGNPACRSDHRMKQAKGWKVSQYPDGRIEWTAPTGRTAITEPHRYPAD
jgi:hypothetical protein